MGKTGRFLASRRVLPGGQVGSLGARARRASAVWFPLRLQAINKLPLGRMRAASKGGFPPKRAGGLRFGPELVLARPEPRVGRWLQESSEVGQEWPSDPPSPAGLGRLGGEARGWGWVIYEPSPYPAPAVSLVFLAFSSSNPVPKASPPTLPSEDLAISGCWSANTGPGRARVLTVWVKPSVLSPRRPHPENDLSKAAGGGLGWRSGEEGLAARLRKPRAFGVDH